jgi:hypothetical protein
MKYHDPKQQAVQDAIERANLALNAAQREIGKDSNWTKCMLELATLRLIEAANNIAFVGQTIRAHSVLHGKADPAMPQGKLKSRIILP